MYYHPSDEDHGSIRTTGRSICHKMAYRSTIHSSTGCMPNLLMLGREVRMRRRARECRALCLALLQPRADRGHYRRRGNQTVTRNGKTLRSEAGNAEDGSEDLLFRTVGAERKTIKEASTGLRRLCLRCMESDQVRVDQVRSTKERPAHFKSAHVANGQGEHTSCCPQAGEAHLTRLEGAG